MVACRASTKTSHVELAEQWLSLVPGLEGVVAERADSRYLPGQRGWVKVKRQRTADCVVIGLAGDLARPALVLACEAKTASCITSASAVLLAPLSIPVRPYWSRSAQNSSRYARDGSTMPCR